MAATIKDYIRECDIYGYSQEHYDLMKECAEIDVAAKFIENQQFMAEIGRASCRERVLAGV